MGKASRQGTKAWEQQGVGMKVPCMGGFPYGCGRGEAVCPLCLLICPKKATKGRKEQCWLCCFVEAAVDAAGQPVDHCTGEFPKWLLGIKLNLSSPDSRLELDG